MEIISKVLESVPFPVIMSCAIIIVAAWVMREYNGWKTYKKVLRHNLFKFILALVVLGLAMFHSFQNKRTPPPGKYTQIVNANDTDVSVERVGGNILRAVDVNKISNIPMAGSAKGYVTHTNGTRLELQIGGVLEYDNCARFSIVSSGSGRYVVQRLYIRLHGYAESELRDEVSEVAAFNEYSAYHIAISSKYSEYDLIPLRPPGEFGSWQYKGEDSDEFYVGFECEPYTLYFVSIEMEARDLGNDKTLKFSSPLYKLITVKKGNSGGALDLNRWYNPKLLKLPALGRYIDSIPTLQHQLLIVNLDRDTNYLSEVGGERLKLVIPYLREVMRNRGDNPVFAGNVRSIKEYLERE